MGKYSIKGLKEGYSEEELGQIRSFIRRNMLQKMDYNQIRQEGFGCGWSLLKYIKWLYPGEENKQKRVEAMQRETVFYNITTAFNTLGIGLFASMEKEVKENPDMDPGIINNVKAAIIGPACGIGDSLYQVTWRVICASIAIPFALEGSILGALLYLLIFYVPMTYIFIWLGYYSYRMGSKLITNVYQSGLLPVFTKAANIVGMVMVGSLIAKQVNVNLALQIAASEEQVLSVQSAIDGIIPGLLGLLLTLGIFKAIRNKISPNVIMLAIFAVGIVATYFGIL